MADVKLNFDLLGKPEGLADLDKYLSYHSFVGGVKNATTDDVAVFNKLADTPSQSAYPNVYRWYLHVKTWHKNPPSGLPKGHFKVDEAKKADDDLDLFGDAADDEDDGDSLKKKMEAMKAAKTKKKPVNKSSLVLHIEPASVDVDLDEVLRLVKGLKVEGLTWGEASTRIPLAFGIEKLQVMCTIVDDLVNTNEVVEMIESLGLTEDQKKLKEERDDEDDYDSDDEVLGLVQSATIVSFNKL
ncbi:translation elongation factor E1-F beta [Theileria orientalis strain Shintoku]|uniref:Translation elongation factor E1-F beta n=1 Tax=Theileria orientalis strain Shintoku TaxID=869250 RepID=J4CCL1_THEOR|nr:translation elongation factor E1-F beta [Theileria orientalis strain Shintoku]PVC49613.1 translation elongation factor E1-F beta [Theileria orientalis]BAM39582.1 translation elongation factor E1-F beta [Theileria orientalis strain Shintoku]|eukprot:XP_009689883.1 translation elongation factor E1-F beta [Theileria orientalis strain Shintoku]